MTGVTVPELPNQDVVGITSVSPALEAQLITDIANLWAVHTETKANVRRTREELRSFRRQLGEKLYAMKSLLARTGRSGGWAAYHRTLRLPRATADRYVREHEATMLPPELNRLTESISEPAEDKVRQFTQKLLSRLRRVLTTHDAVYYFLDELAHLASANTL